MERFLETLKVCNKTSKFYFDNIDILEMKNMRKEIEKLNILIGEIDFDNKLKNIILLNPQLVSLFPLLIGVRELSVDLLVEYTYDKPWVTSTYLFNKNDLGEKSLQGIIEFFKNVGLKEFFQNEEIVDVYSYLLGMHLGLKTNARKNKSGTFMEKYIESYLSRLCFDNNLKYLPQATSKEILREFNIDIEDTLKNRRADFAINNNGKLILIESNFYNSPGSKIKSVTQEFIKFSKECADCDAIQDFIWITDGAGWLKDKKTLEKAFSEIENIININDMQNKYIENKLKQ